MRQHSSFIYIFDMAGVSTQNLLHDSQNQPICTNTTTQQCVCIDTPTTNTELTSVRDCTEPV